MDRLDVIFSILNDSLDTKEKRHMVGGVLLSVSLFFGGLALTVMTLNNQEGEYE